MKIGWGEWKPANGKVLEDESVGGGRERPDASECKVFEHPHNVTFIQLIIWSLPLHSLVELRNIFLQQPAPVVIKSCLRQLEFLRGFEHMWGLRRRKWFRVSGPSSEMLQPLWVNVLDFKIASASATTVWKTENVNFRLPSTISRLLFAVCISLSQTPPKCGANGGLKVHWMFCWVNCSLMYCLSGL